MNLVEVTCQLQFHFFLAQARVFVHVSVEVYCVTEFHKYFAELTLTHLENTLKEFKKTNFLIRSTDHFICKITCLEKTFVIDADWNQFDVVLESPHL